MDFIITIDTEGDNQWARPETVTTENTRFIPRFQALCDRFGLKPTYLCTYEMLMDSRFRDTVGPYQESGRAEIGAHLHPWTSPPFENEAEERKHHAFPCELPLPLFEAKLHKVTEAIDEVFGHRPTSYRAGRYGFDVTHIDVLLRLGYVVDCSVAPCMTYTECAGAPGGKGGSDYRRAEPGAYFLNRDDLSLPGDSALLEVPITILHTRWPLRNSTPLQQWQVHHATSMASRALHRLGYGPRWFRPLPSMTVADLCDIWRAAERKGLPCAEMMFHSSELMPGGSPSFPDAASIERLYEVFEAVFAFIASRGGQGMALTDFARPYTRGPANENRH